MFDKPKRKKKKSGQRPRWQTALPWLLLLMAVGMVGYAYLLESRPTPATLQKVQESNLAERTPAFNDDTRYLVNDSATDLSETLQTRPGSSSGGVLRDLVNDAHSSAVSPNTLQGTSALCGVYGTLTRCQTKS